MLPRLLRTPYAGPAIMLVASAFMAFTSVLAKAMGTGAGGGAALHPFQISFFRFIVAFALVSVALAALRPSLAGAPWRLHALRSFLGWSTVSCLFLAALHIPLADATAIGFLGPAGAMVLAARFLGERPGAARWSAGCVMVAGALLLLRPGVAVIHWAAFAALASAVFNAVEAVLIKYLSRTEPTLRMLWINNLFGVFIAAVPAALVWQTPGWAELALGAALGAAMLCVQICFLTAMKLGDASYIGPFFYATLVFAALYDLALFGDAPDFWGAVGAGVILLGAVAMAAAEGRRRAAVPPA
ncbi:MAG: DMT family transporter [Pseudomonadota bacterium]